MHAIFFYMFAVIVVLSAIGVITASNAVHSVMWLVACFIATSGLWLLMQAEFLAIVLVLVYVGAVMVLFLFVVMMLNVKNAPLREGFTRYLPIGGVIVLTLGIEFALIFLDGRFDLNHYPVPEAYPADYSNTRELGRILFTEYVLPFELAAVLLLVAIVAAIALTLRRREGTRHQDPVQQVKVRAKDRVRLVKMPVESPKEPLNKSGRRRL